MKTKRITIACWAIVLMLVCATGVSAQNVLVYDSIPKPLPGNVVSLGFECCAVMEAGAGLSLVASAGGTLGQVSVIMSSWACQNGNVYAGNCVTTPGATFAQPITVNVWALNDLTTPPSAGGLLGTITETFDIPFRPSSTPDQCGGDNTRWYNSKDKTCYHGLATPIIVNFASQHIVIPPNNQIIITVGFSTTDFGLNPIGPSACNSPAYNNGAGCPYDSLNVSADTTDGNFNNPGSPTDPNGIFVRPAASPYAYAACSNLPMTPGVLADDTGCWAGLQPEIQVRANTNATPNKKVSAP